jgi:hypothetical protein
MTDTVIFVLGDVAFSRTASRAVAFSLPGRTARACPETCGGLTDVVWGGLTELARGRLTDIAWGGLTDRGLMRGDFAMIDLFFLVRLSLSEIWT